MTKGSGPKRSSRVEILVLAAGASSRMAGRDKLLEPVAGSPLLSHIVGNAQATGLPVLVTLPPDRPERIKAVSALKAKIVTVHEANLGMAASFHAYCALGRDVDGVMIVLADMPDIRAQDMLDLVGRFEALGGTQAVRAGTAAGQPGHPVIFPKHLIARFSELSGDVGGSALLRGEKVDIVPLPGTRAITDLDTPQDWAEWRAKQR